MTMTKPRAKTNATPRARRPRVGPRAEAELGAEPAVEAAGLAAQTQSATEALRAMLRAALDLVASPAFVITSSGEVLESNPVGREWLMRDPARAAMLHEAARGRPPMGVVVTRAREAGDALVLVGHEPLERGARGLVAATSRRWRFTPREREVLTLLVDGCSNRAIAATLSIAVRTVEAHLSSMFEKAAVDSRAELVARALRA
jgi:DNA-binding CsgD family transcriptional regulator